MGKGALAAGGRAAALVAVGFAAACAGKTYLAEADAPARAKAGIADPQLRLTQAFGGPLSPIVRNVALPRGRLDGRSGLRSLLAAELHPLDIVLVRSRPALTRALITSHFTHATVWLGTPAEMKALGVWDLPALRPYRAKLAAGATVLESAGDAVRLSTIDVVENVDEIAILRMRRGGRPWLRRKYAALFERLGTPFDFNFDQRDTTRLTCAELVDEVFPELALPVRYARGRFAILPDDLVRVAAAGGRLRVRRHIRPRGPQGLALGGRDDALAVLTSPAPAPI